MNVARHAGPAGETHGLLGTLHSTDDD